MSQENVEIVRRVVGAFQRGQLDVALGFFDPEITWQMAEDEPDAGRYHGHAGIRTMIGKWLELFDELHVEPEEFMDAGDAVVMPYRLRARARSTGIEISGKETWLLELRNGKVIRVREYREKAEALEAAGLRE
jgi:uncharacterized protein